MNLITHDRGFELLVHPAYLSKSDEELTPRLVLQSSVIGDYPDAYRRPGTSALWIGEHHHLNRDEIAQLICHLQWWLRTGSLKLKD